MPTLRVPAPARLLTAQPWTVPVLVPMMIPEAAPVIVQRETLIAFPPVRSMPGPTTDAICTSSMTAPEGALAVERPIPAAVQPWMPPWRIARFE